MTPCPLVLCVYRIPSLRYSGQGRQNCLKELEVHNMLVQRSTSKSSASLGVDGTEGVSSTYPEVKLLLVLSKLVILLIKFI